MAFKFEKYALGGFGDNTVVDVDALPTENIDQSKIYRVTSETSTTYGIPDEADNKTVYEHTSATGWKELGAGGGGGGEGSGIIDVTELPEVGVENAVYRLDAGAELWVNFGEDWWNLGKMDIVQASVVLTAMNPTSPMRVNSYETYVVEALPDTMKPVDMNTWHCPVYIIESTGIGYVSGDGTNNANMVLPVNMLLTNLLSNKGWVEDINSIPSSESGVYAYRSKKLYVYQNGAFIELEEKAEPLKLTLSEDGTHYIISATAPNLVFDHTGLDPSYTSYPTTYNDLPVSEIAEKGFRLCKGLGVLVGDGESNLGGITKIGDYAFDGCVGLGFAEAEGEANVGSQALPDTLTSLGKYAFRNCFSLYGIKFGTGLTTIPEGLCYNCARMTEVEIPVNITAIEEDAFCDAPITSITYGGTKEQWKAITKGRGWNSNTGDYIITCTDGTIAKNGTET